MSRAFALNWLKFAAVLTIVVGFVASLASHPAGAGLWLALFDVLAWPIDGNPAGFDATGFALNAVLGGLLVGWGVTIWLLAAGPIARGQAGTARIVLLGLAAWFLVDSAGSLVAQMPGNVVLNAGFMALFLPPLLRLMRE